MKSALSIHLIAIALFLNACIEPINVSVKPGNSGNLVVYGMVTDQEGPYHVELSLSSAVFDEKQNLDVTDATLKIIDDLERTYRLFEISDGLYSSVSTDFKGEVGRSYMLSIELENGNKFESTLEPLIQNAGIEKIYYEFRVKNQLFNNVEIKKSGLDLYVDANASELGETFNRWRWKGTTEVLAFPELHKKKVSGGWVPDPLPCSGVVYDSITTNFYVVGMCECCNCWVEETSANSIVSNQSKQQKLYLKFIEASARNFYYKYYMEVDQLSLSQSGYEFWNAIKKQQEQGALFDANQSIPTNIQAVNNNERVLGYFGASSVKSISKFITHQDLPVRIAPLDTLTNTCLQIDNASIVKPKFW